VTLHEGIEHYLFLKLQPYTQVRFKLFFASKVVRTTYKVLVAFDSENQFEESFTGSLLEIPGVVQKNLQKLSLFIPLRPMENWSFSDWLFEKMEDVEIFYFRRLLTENVLPSGDDQHLLAVSIAADPATRKNLLPKIYEAFSNLVQPLNTFAQESISESLILFALKEMVYLLNAHDPYTYQHSLRVADLASFIAFRILGEDTQTKLMFRAGLIHDLGKIWIPMEILYKEGKLDHEEFKIVQEHVVRLEQLFLGDPFLKEAVEVARKHHEYLDGTGYLKYSAEEIPVLSRILTVADISDALLHDRPYRQAMDLARAFSILRSMTQEGKLDTSIVKMASELLPSFYSGTVAEDFTYILKMHPVAIMIPFAEETLFLNGTIMNVGEGFFEILASEIPAKVKKGERVQMEVYSGAVSRTYRGQIRFLYENRLMVRLDEDLSDQKPLRILWAFPLVVESVVKERRQTFSKKFDVRTRFFGSDGLSFIIEKKHAEFLSGDIVFLHFDLYGEKTVLKGLVIDNARVDLKFTEYFVHYSNVNENELSRVYRSIFRREIEMKVGLKIFPPSPSSEN